MTPTVIDSKDLGQVDGFDLRAYLTPDVDANPSGYECYDQADLVAWESDQWSYVGCVVEASRAGVVLGSAAVWSMEYGSMPGIEKWVNPLDEVEGQFANGYGEGLIDEAIAEAKAKLAEMNRVDA